MVKIDWLSVGLILVVLLATLAVYPLLPDEIPRHWNFRGEVDAWGPPAWIFLTVGLAAVTYVVLAVLPALDGRGTLAARADVYRDIVRLFVILVLLIHFAYVAAALGYGVGLVRVLGVAAGALLMLVGNRLPQLRQNHIAGIRTPWTLRDEATWRTTHRAGGRAFIIAGAVQVVLSLLLSDLWLLVSLMGIVLGLLVWSLIFSSRVYRLHQG